MRSLACVGWVGGVASASELQPGRLVWYRKLLKGSNYWNKVKMEITTHHNKSQQTAKWYALNTIHTHIHTCSAVYIIPIRHPKHRSITPKFVTRPSVYLCTMEQSALQTWMWCSCDPKYLSLFKAQIKENIKAPRHWPLWGKFTGDRWIPRTKGQ